MGQLVALMSGVVLGGVAEVVGSNLARGKIFTASIGSVDSLYPSVLVGWFCCFMSQVNSYGHCGTVSSPNHTFSWAGLNKRLTSNSCTYFRL